MLQAAEEIRLRVEAEELKAREAAEQAKREAIERKAVKSYKALSKDCHPDKLPRAVGVACAKELDAMMRAVFERAEALKHCVTKPLRCTLPPPTPTKRTCVGGAKSCNKAEL